MVILGFGSQETETAIKIIRECADALKSGGCSSLKDIQTKYSEDGDRYKKQGRDIAPERYSYFFVNCYEIYNGRYFVEFTMHHINRNHPFSTDGWALLATQWVLSVSIGDEVIIYRREA